MADVRPTDDPSQPGYWIGSGQSILFDAALNDGEGGFVAYTDLLRISKGATLDSSEECDCTATVTLDIDARPATFQYFPSHALDVVFVLDVTSSMMGGSSLKFAQAKRAIITTINQMWAVNRDTTVTIVPYGRAAFVPNQSPATGFAYDYPGTLFQWRRSSAYPGYFIGQILGYRNQTNVSATDLTTFEAQTVPRAASAQLSLYNSYNYYKIRYSDIYDDAGNPLPDTVLTDYIANVYNPAEPSYANNVIAYVAQGLPLPANLLPYSMNDSGYANNTILQNLVWAIPYSEDTNTEAGIQEAYTLFKTPGFAQSDDIFRRAAILITDGQANRSINPQYPNSLAAPGDTDARFFPDVPGEAWKYFTQLQQTLPTLVAEISNRSSTFEEIILASSRLLAVADRLKNPADGNTSIYVLGIDISAQSPGPYTTENVIQLLESTATAPAFFREAKTSDPQSQIADLLQRLVQDLFFLYAGCRVVLHDRINTALFTYVPGSIQIRGVRDGLLLKSPNQPVIVDPSDPDYTVYPKAPLLPDVDDDSVAANGSITLDFGAMPLGLLALGSETTVRLSYRVQSTPFANGSRLPTNIDAETFIAFVEPSHLVGSSSAIDYSAAPRELLFQSGVVSCSCAPFAAMTVEKFVDRSTAAPNDLLAYTVRVTNTGTLTLANIALDDPLLGLHLVIPILEPLGVFVTAVPYRVPAGAPAGLLTNTVTARNEEFPEPLTATANVLISLTPSVLFTKTVNKTQALPGELVVFTLTSINNGNVDLTNIHVVDALLGIDTHIDRIPVGATVTADFPYIIPNDAAPGSFVVNIAIGTADEIPPITVGVSVEVLPTPILTIRKQAEPTAIAPGGTVTFTIVVENLGSVELTNIRVTDPTLGLDTTIAAIPVGGTAPIVFPFLVPLETPPVTYINTATAVSDQTGPISASAEVDVLPTPRLGITKLPDRTTVGPGGIVQYEIVLSNPGNVPLTSIRLQDPLLGLDVVVPSLLVGETHSVTATYRAPADALIGSVIANRATASSPEAGAVEAEAVVAVVGIGLSLAKSVDMAIAMAGDTVFYTLTVTNPLPVPQTNVRLEDAQLGLSETIPSLAPGETIVRTLPYVVPDAPEGTVIRNRFSCASDQTPSQSTEAQVIVFQMLTGTTLAVAKVPNTTLAVPGGTIFYSATVTNVGGSTAFDIIVTDSLTGTRRRIPALAAGESAIVTFTYLVPEQTPQGTVVANRVLVTSPQADPATSEANVTILLPRFLLQLTKTVDRAVAAPGEYVNFTVAVANISPFTLTDVHVFDVLTSLGALVPALAPGESRTFALPFRIPPDTRGGTTFVNIATAFSNETPFEQASATVTAQAIADFTIVETVDKPVIRIGETAFFTIRIRNVGNVDLIRFRFVAPLLGIVYETELFPIGGEIVVRVPYVGPEVDEDTLFPSPVTGQADNAGPKSAHAAVTVIPEEEE